MKHLSLFFAIFFLITLVNTISSGVLGYFNLDERFIGTPTKTVLPDGRIHIKLDEKKNQPFPEGVKLPDVVKTKVGFDSMFDDDEHKSSSSSSTSDHYFSIHGEAIMKAHWMDFKLEEHTDASKIICHDDGDKNMRLSIFGASAKIVDALKNKKESMFIHASASAHVCHGQPIFRFVTAAHFFGDEILLITKKADYEQLFDEADVGFEIKHPQLTHVHSDRTLVYEEGQDHAIDNSNTFGSSSVPQSQNRVNTNTNKYDNTNANMKNAAATAKEQQQQEQQNRLAKAQHHHWFHHLVHHVTHAIHHAAHTVEHAVSKVTKAVGKGVKKVVHVVWTIAKILELNFDKDINKNLISVTKNGHQSLYGIQFAENFHFSSAFTFQLHIHHGHLEVFLAQLSGELDLGATATLPPVSKPWNKQKAIWNIPGAKFTFMIGPLPVFIEFSTSCIIAADITLSYSAQVGWHASANAALGVSYTHDRGFQMIHNHDFQRSHTLQYSADLNVAPSLGVQARFTLYTLATAYAQLNAGINIDVSTSNFGCTLVKITANFFVRLSAGAELDIKILHHTLFDKNWGPYQLYQWNWALPTICKMLHKSHHVRELAMAEVQAQQQQEQLPSPDSDCAEKNRECLRKYGNPVYCPDACTCKDKIQQCLRQFGNPIYCPEDKICNQQTCKDKIQQCLRKYGSPIYCPEDKICGTTPAPTPQQQTCSEKIQQCLRKYGSPIYCPEDKICGGSSSSSSTAAVALTHFALRDASLLSVDGDTAASVDASDSGKVWSTSFSCPAKKLNHVDISLTGFFQSNMTVFAVTVSRNISVSASERTQNSTLGYTLYSQSALAVLNVQVEAGNTYNFSVIAGSWNNAQALGIPYEDLWILTQSHGDNKTAPLDLNWLQIAFPNPKNMDIVDVRNPAICDMTLQASGTGSNGNSSDSNTHAPAAAQTYFHHLMQVFGNQLYPEFLHLVKDVLLFVLVIALIEVILAIFAKKIVGEDNWPTTATPIAAREWTFVGACIFAGIVATILFIAGTSINFSGIAGAQLDEDSVQNATDPTYTVDGYIWTFSSVHIHVEKCPVHYGCPESEGNNSKCSEKPKCTTTSGTWSSPPFWPYCPEDSTIKTKSSQCVKFAWDNVLNATLFVFFLLAGPIIAMKCSNTIYRRLLLTHASFMSAGCCINLIWRRMDSFMQEVLVDMFVPAGNTVVPWVMEMNPVSEKIWLSATAVFWAVTGVVGVLCVVQMYTYYKEKSFATSNKKFSSVPPPQEEPASEYQEHQEEEEVSTTNSNNKSRVVLESVTDASQQDFARYHHSEDHGQALM